MFKFSKYLTSLDSFGEPVTLNYKGSSTFKTGVGAFFTIALSAFILTYGLFSLIGVLQYEDPQISQYTIFKIRNEQEQFDFGEMEGKFAFGFVNSIEKTAPVLDPTLGQITLNIQTFGALRTILTEKEIEITSLSRETHPEYFDEASNISHMVDTRGLYTAKNLSDLVLTDNASAFNGTMISLRV